MKMPEHVYESLEQDIRTIIEKMEETGINRIWNRDIDLDALEMRDMWDFVLTINIDRANEDHPRHHEEGHLPRALEFDDRSPYWLHAPENGNLDDSHIETALRRIMADISAERSMRRSNAV